MIDINVLYDFGEDSSHGREQRYEALCIKCDINTEALLDVLGG